MSSTLAAGAVRAGPSTRAGSRSHKSAVVAASGVPASSSAARRAMSRSGAAVRAQRSTLAGQTIVSARCVLQSIRTAVTQIRCHTRVLAVASPAMDDESEGGEVGGEYFISPGYLFQMDSAPATRQLPNVSASPVPYLYFFCILPPN